MLFYSMDLEQNSGALNLIANIVLFLLKLAVGLMANSVAVISDAMHSLLDVVYSIVVAVSIKVSKKGADKEHPFGHARAQPIAAFIAAILSFVVAFEVFKSAFERIFFGSSTINITYLTLGIIGLSIVLKVGMFFVFGKVASLKKSVALKACSVDSRNDSLASFVVLIGIFAAQNNIIWADSLAALFVGLIITKTGYDLAKENLVFLMGESPGEDFLHKIKEDIKKVKGVRKVHGLKAHFVGTKIHLEVHVHVNKNLTVEQAHEIEGVVSKVIQKHPGIGETFIQVDPA